MSNKADLVNMNPAKKRELKPKLRFPEFRDAGEWEKKTIGQISRNVIAGGTPSTLEKKYWNGNIRWMNSGELNHKRVYEVQGRITEEGLQNSSTKLIPKQCVLIGLAGQGKTRGTVAINMVELCTNQSIAAIFPNEKLFDSNFLYHGLDDRYDELRRLSAGGEGRGGLNLQIIKSLRINLPQLHEQQKIADCFSSTDDRITAETHKLGTLKAHKKGLMQQLFPAEGETLPKLRFPEFRDVGEWKIKEFSKYIVLYRGSSPRPIQSYLSSDSSGVNWIKIGDTKSAKNFIISQVDERITPEGAEKSRKVNVGELILANSMSYGKTYQVAIDGYIYDGWFVLRNYEKYFDKKFLLQLLNSEYMQNQYKRFSAGGIVQNISSDIVYKTVLPHTSLKEQQKIADCLSSLDELIAAQTQKIDTLKVHKKGLMQQLFPALDEVKG